MQCCWLPRGATHCACCGAAVQGADAWAVDRCGGRTALHYAAMRGSGESMEALLAHLPEHERPA